MNDQKARRIAINTGGGDAPGLNAVIRAAVLSARRRGWEVFGIHHGYAGLLDTSKIVPRINRLRLQDPQLGGRAYRHEFERLQNKYAS